MSLRLTVLKYGDTVFGENYIFSGGDKEKLLPITFCFFLIESETRKILVDTGCDDGAGFPMSVFKTPVESLADIGITPDDITDIIVTHAHHDHIEGVHHFPRATIHIQNDEYARGKKYIPEGFCVNTFDEVLPLCRGVLVRSIGGHSVGSCIVELDGDDTTYVVSGDECYSRRCLDEYILTGSSVCPEKSRAFLEKYRAPEYTVLLCHESSPVR